MKRHIHFVGSILTAFIIYSCSQVSIQESAPTITPSATIAPTRTESASPTLPTGNGTPIPIHPDEQVYIDPEGWYTVYIPAAWKADDNPGSFSVASGFFETGYLTELGFIGKIDVCVWLANIGTNSESHSIQLYYDYTSRRWNCGVETETPTGEKFIRAIFENPKAGYEHRYIYLKADEKNIERIKSTFSWLRPVDVEKETVAYLDPMRPEDQAFWENTAPMPAGFSVQEYVLPPEAQAESPAKTIFLKFIPSIVPTPVKNASQSHDKPDVSEQLMAIGYELKTIQTDKTFNRQLYKDGELLFEHVYKVSNVYTYSTPTGPLTAFVVDTANTQSGTPVFDSYLVQNDVVTEWSFGYNDPPYAPVLHKGELLWIRATKNAHVQVQTSDREVVFSFATYFGTHIPVNQFRGWNDHWILEIGNFIIQDGEILNEKYGFEETFDWFLVSEKPLYFFRKGPRIGISYNGQFLPVYYDYVPHGFCCGLGLNNPFIFDNEIRFFGKRDGVWY